MGQSYPGLILARDSGSTGYQHRGWGATAPRCRAQHHRMQLKLGNSECAGLPRLVPKEASPFILKPKVTWMEKLFDTCSI